ncbi:hypothetical protein I6A84_43690 [Frankia sp. CNm7]|uniref:Uncharacterized protein n=1 Tax=Frankia nepalensis TaxID=1836974 RepID=A0A937RCL0_9ACTN|nr:hypothetical protein [Frankia nepalensis]MBL7494808.1 hypothetical protein [Frankia nepalensis]MBL7514105.1 hypothetical protein [Frankia nepalensis]MBL7524766.1 hypothetical protein [Frankia nepalensis]MBL7626515.1 hypothetical protein [Frankia nepalensis]
MSATYERPAADGSRLDAAPVLEPERPGPERPGPDDPRHDGPESAGSAPSRAALGAEPDETPAGRAGHRRREPRRMPRWPLLFVGYLALAALLLRSLWQDPDGRGYGVSDATLFSWYMGWVPHALGHGMNPFVTDAINFPDGVNILWSTPVVLLAVLVTPITLLAGPVAAFNTLLALALAVSAIAMYGAARRFVAFWPAAVAGLLYGFSPYMIGASFGHLHLTFAPFPPLLLVLLHDLLTGRRAPRRTGVLLGLAVAAQMLIGEELVATSALVGALGLLILAARAPSAVPAAVGSLARALGWCALVAGVLLAWPLAVQLAGPQRVDGAIQPHDVAVSDLFTFAIPTTMQWLAPDRALAHSLRFTGSPVEVSAYFGVPLLALLAVLAVRLRRDGLVRVLTPLFVLVAVLSLGGRLHVDGRITGVWLPWALVEQLPLIGSALASRLSLYLTLFAGLALAIWLDQHRSRPWRRQAAVALLTAAVLVPLVPAPMRAEPLRSPEFFTTAAVEVIPRGSTVLVAPYPRPDVPDAMLWQARAGFRFDLPGCYCTVPGPNGGAQFHGDPSPLTTALLRVEEGSLTAAQALALPGLRRAYEDLSPDAVIVGPAHNRAELVELVTGLTGRLPVEKPGGVALWGETFRA